MSDASGRATVVIGAAYGDEGKGVLTDYRAARMHDPIVVRFNGGAQAGHTVVTPDGRRHVFSHVGSGAFAGARTYLSRHFVANPLIFARELAELRQLGVGERALRPVTDARAIVTTPYDMLLNQMVETVRGLARHGSVGIGFGETIERNLDARFALTTGDLAGGGAGVRDRLSALLARIRRDWVPRRAAALGLGDPSSWELALPDFAAALRDDELPERWIDDALAFASATDVCHDARFLATAAARDALVFEGAQGLMLDQDRGAFPFVTRSNTGLKNVLDIASEAGIEQLDVIYAHRAYATRHGSGPLPHELAAPPYEAIVDETNRPNAFQGSLRFALPDLDLIATAVRADLADAPRSVAVRPALAITCLEQVDDAIRYVADGEERSAERGAFLRAALDRTGFDRLLTSDGPTRANVRESADHVPVHAEGRLSRNAVRPSRKSALP